MSPRRRDERGAAALELALVLSVLLGLTAFVLPVPFALLEKSRLEQATNRTVRWATSVPDGVRPLPRGSSPAVLERRQDLVEQEARAALGLVGARSTVVDVRLVPSTPTHCPLDRALTVEVDAEVDLGALTALVDAVRPGTPDRTTITASATACEE